MLDVAAGAGKFKLDPLLSARGSTGSRRPFAKMASTTLVMVLHS